MELKDIAEGSLGNLALVRGVRGEEFGTGGDVRDHRRGVMVVRAGAGEHLERGVLCGKAFKELTHLLFAQCVREVVLPFIDEIRRDVGVKVVERIDSYLAKHLADIFLCVGEIAESWHYLSVKAL